MCESQMKSVKNLISVKIKMKYVKSNNRKNQTKSVKSNE